MFNQKRQAAAAPRVHPNSCVGDNRLKRRGHGSLNSELFQKLYFSTSSKTALPDHTENKAALQQSVQPSMKSLNQGAGYVKSSLPAPQRSECTYSCEYKILPLDDAPVQKEMRQLIASKSRAGSSTNQVVEGLRLSSDTTTKAFYGSYGDKPARVDPAMFVKPDQNIRLSKDAKFMESKTVFQRDFKGHDEEVQRKFRLAASKCGAGDQLDSLKRRGKFDDMTSYKREFGKEPAARHPGALSKSQSAAQVLQRARAWQESAFSGR